MQTLYSVNERDSSVELCVELRDGMLERDAIVTFSTVDDSATSTGWPTLLDDQTLRPRLVIYNT